MNEPAKQPLELPAATYEPQLSASIDLERCLSGEVLLHVFDLSGTHEVKTCYGDVVKIVNALRDYAKLLELVCDEWELAGFHRATYEYQAEKLRQIADKLQCGIGYDYDAAVRKCQKLRGKKPRNDDVGEDAIQRLIWKTNGQRTNTRPAPCPVCAAAALCGNLLPKTL